MSAQKLNLEVLGVARVQFNNFFETNCKILGNEGSEVEHFNG